MDTEYNFKLVKNEVEKMKHGLEEMAKELGQLQSKVCSNKLSTEEMLNYSARLKGFHRSIKSHCEDLGSCYEHEFSYLHKITQHKSWMIEENEDMHYTFLNGDNPWAFTLKSTSFQMFGRIQELILDYRRRFALTKHDDILKIGEEVLCTEGSRGFRGICTGVTQQKRYIILDVDADSERIVSKDNIFVVPTEVREIPMLTVRCSLTMKKYGKQYWNEQMKFVFKKCMRELKFTFKTIDQTRTEFPPRYYVELSGYTENKRKLDVNGWFIDVIHPLLIETQGSEEMIDEEKLNITSFDEGSLNLDKLKALLQKEKPSSPEHPIEQLPDSSARSKLGWEVSSSQTYVEEETEERIAAVMNIENTQTLNVGGSYNEEVRTCRFYKKEGCCLKSDCLREHVGPVGPGYLGSLYTYGHLNEVLALPEEEETVVLNPKSIIAGHVFYAHIIAKPRPFELTLDKIEQRMNNHQEVIRYEMLELLPTLGELVLAYSDRRRRWFRSRVIELQEKTVKVFDIDYGQEENIDFKNLRKINFDLLVLPAQAVQCTLYNIQAKNPFVNMEAKIILRDFILSKKIQAKVNIRNLLETSLEVTVFLPKGGTINDKLVSLGHYSYITSK